MERWWRWRGGKFECTLRAAVVFVKMHKTIMGATHFFFGGVLVVATGWGSWNMWEYELIRYRLVGGDRPAASYYKVIGPGSTSGAGNTPFSN